MSLTELQHRIATALTGGRIAPALDVSALTLAAELLIAKRRAEAAGWLPRTSAALGAAFRQRFTDHARTYHPHGFNHPRDDAAAFAKHLAGDHTCPVALRDLARLELAGIRAAQPGPFLLTLRLTHDPTRDGRAGIHLWWRWRRTAYLRHLCLPWG